MSESRSRTRATTPGRDRPRIFGLFEKRIEGDDCLLELARQRFREAGLGAEIYAATLEQLEWTMKFRPAAAAPVVVHLSRDLNLAEEQSRQQIVDFARGLAGRAYGLVLHDHPDLANRPEEYLWAADQMQKRLDTIAGGPRLFVEYAAGLHPRAFAEFFEDIHDLSLVSACLDTGHVGIGQARQAYAEKHPGEDICALKSNPAQMPMVMPDLEAAVKSALPGVLRLIDSLARLRKPVHIHLHDGHPLSTFSFFGVSDHLSFLAEIPLSFEYDGRRTTPLMFGPAGLSRIVKESVRAIGPELVSFTLEIHPVADRLALADASPLFSHWVDKTNAEIMNHWLWTLGQNHELLREALSAERSAYSATLP